MTIAPYRQDQTLLFHIHDVTYISNTNHISGLCCREMEFGLRQTVHPKNCPKRVLHGQHDWGSGGGSHVGLVRQKDSLHDDADSMDGIRGPRILCHQPLPLAGCQVRQTFFYL